MAGNDADQAPPFEFSPEESWTPSLPVVGTAVHAGHDLRPEVAHRSAVPAEVRAREEDALTDRIVAGIPARAVVHRSRFEVDLNRSRDDAVYREPDDAWGLDLWAEPLSPAMIARSLRLHDAFYTELAARLDRLAARRPFVLLDVHSYNHRRGGPGAPAAPEDENPEVNLGTRSVETGRWSAVVDTLARHLGAVDVGDHTLDVRENVRFGGAHLVQWVNERYPGRGCAVAIEFKKVFMDEWTGAVDDARLARLRDGLTAAATRVAESLVRAGSGMRA